MMRNSICGADCSKCPFQEKCKGCAETKGRPFGRECLLAACCHSREIEACEHCRDSACSLREQLIKEFNALGISDMPKVTELFPLAGSFVNMEYELPGGQKVKLLSDGCIYLGNQLCKKDSDRCYGLAADEKYLLVCEYGDNGAEPEIVVYARRAQRKTV